MTITSLYYMSAVQSTGARIVIHHAYLLILILLLLLLIIVTITSDLLKTKIFSSFRRGIHSHFLFF